MANIKSLGISTALIFIIIIFLVLSMTNSYYTENGVNHCLFHSDSCSGCFGECNITSTDCDSNISEKCKGLKAIMIIVAIFTFIMLFISIACDLDVHSHTDGVIFSYISIGSLALINLVLLSIYAIVLSFVNTELCAKSLDTIKAQASYGIAYLITSMVLTLIVAIMGIGTHQHL